MPTGSVGRVAILFPGDRRARLDATPSNNRFADLFAAFAARGVDAEPAVYHDDFLDEVRAQLLAVQVVLVWVNPEHEGRDRRLLDAMLREVAAAGVFVSAHPDAILAMGTKRVLFRTRGLGWGCDTHLYASMQEMRATLPALLAEGQVRVLKQLRGHGGSGVWRIERDGGAMQADPSMPVRVRHAQRGSTEQRMRLDEFLLRCERHFGRDGGMVDQAWQARLPEGTIRCYLVHDRVRGFGHQAVNALHPPPPGRPAEEAPPPGPRLYHPPDREEFQDLRRTLETQWLPAMQRLLGIGTEALPVLWDADFLLGPKDAAGNDTYVLCEINVSSVAPYPESCVPHVVEATVARLRGRSS